MTCRAATPPGSIGTSRAGEGWPHLQARAVVGGIGALRSRRWPSPRRRSAFSSGDSGARSMRTRFSALAHGSQPAVVKLASYGGGARAAAMISYTSREGELTVENERGEQILGKAALSAQRAEWEHLFDNRAASRDIGVFHVAIDSAPLADESNRDEQVREILRAGLGDRRFVYGILRQAGDELEVSGVVVLRDSRGERLTGDRKAAGFIQQRYDDSEVGQDIGARFRFRGYGNGVEWGTARVRQLVERTDGEVRTETGLHIADAAQAGDLVQKQWRKELHSRKGRDVMHLIVSARAGTDAGAFQNAVREFLGDQFPGHRYVFAVHDPALDPKEMEEGGKRPHIHAHAIVTTRSELGGRIETSPKIFREWRSLMAEKAREQGIEMELTDRRELASAPAYSRNQVRPVSYRGRTEHDATSEAARARYQAKRSNEVWRARSPRSREHAAVAAEVWNELTKERLGGAARFVEAMTGRFEGTRPGLQIDKVIGEWEADGSKNNANMLLLERMIQGKVGQMREMTRPEFEAYEKRVEAVISSVEQTLDPFDRTDFDEVAAAAREVVSIRREYLEFTERRVEATAEHAARTAAPDWRHGAVTDQPGSAERFGAKTDEPLRAETEPVESSHSAYSRTDEAQHARQAAAGPINFGGESKDGDRVSHDVSMADPKADTRDGSHADGNDQQVDSGREPMSRTSSIQGHPDQKVVHRQRLLAEQGKMRSKSEPLKPQETRLRQIELEFGERNDRDRDDRER